MKLTVSYERLIFFFSGEETLVKTRCWFASTGQRKQYNSTSKQHKHYAPCLNSSNSMTVENAQARYPPPEKTAFTLLSFTTRTIKKEYRCHAQVCTKPPLFPWMISFKREGGRQLLFT